MQTNTPICFRIVAIVALTLGAGSVAHASALSTDWAAASRQSAFQMFLASHQALSQTIVAQTQNAMPAAESEESATATLDRVVDRVQSYYDSVRDFVADFEQEYTSAAMGETRTSHGRVFFKKPGKMRWDYAAPTERYLISDGRQLWIYEPEYGQYFTESLSESQLPAALRFLMGEGDLRENFTISLGDARGGRTVLNLEPKVPNSQYARLRFVVDDETGAVEETVIFDAIGNQNRLKFTNARQNQGLPDSGFDFEPPSGAVQIEAPR